MEMTIDEALKVWLPVIQMGVETMPECKEALDMAIATMRKYQKIQEIYLKWIRNYDITTSSAWTEVIEVLKDE